MYCVYTDIGWGKQWQPVDSTELHIVTEIKGTTSTVCDLLTHSTTEWRGNLHQLLHVLILLKL